MEKGLSWPACCYRYHVNLGAWKTIDLRVDAFIQDINIYVEVVLPKGEDIMIVQKLDFDIGYVDANIDINKWPPYLPCFLVVFIPPLHLLCTATQEWFWEAIISGIALFRDQILEPIFKTYVIGNKDLLKSVPQDIMEEIKDAFSK